MSKGWGKGQNKPTYKGELFNLPEYNFFSRTGLPDGAYKIFFKIGIDINRNGLADREEFVVKTSKVNVLSEKVSDEVIKQNGFVYEIMKKGYLWNSKVPDVDLSQYRSPEDLLFHLKSDRDRWSDIVSAKKRNNFFEDGKHIGLGFAPSVGADNKNLVINKIDKGFPAR